METAMTTPKDEQAHVHHVFIPGLTPDPQLPHEPVRKTGTHNPPNHKCGPTKDNDGPPFHESYFRNFIFWGSDENWHCRHCGAVFEGEYTALT
jgi:hypothetical protein